MMGNIRVRRPHIENQSTSTGEPYLSPPSTEEPYLSPPSGPGVDTSANPSTLRPNPRDPHHVGSSACSPSVFPYTWDWDKEGGLLGVQASELGQEEAAALGDGLLGGGGSQVALKGQDLLLLPLRDLQLTVDHLGPCLLIRQRARWV